MVTEILDTTVSMFSPHTRAGCVALAVVFTQVRAASRSMQNSKLLQVPFFSAGKYISRFCLLVILVRQKNEH